MNTLISMMAISCFWITKFCFIDKWGAILSFRFKLLLLRLIVFMQLFSLEFFLVCAKMKVLWVEKENSIKSLMNVVCVLLKFIAVLIKCSSKWVKYCTDGIQTLILVTWVYKTCANKLLHAKTRWILFKCFLNFWVLVVYGLMMDIAALWQILNPQKHLGKKNLHSLHS